MAGGTSGRLDQIIGLQAQQNASAEQRNLQREQMTQQERMQRRALRQQAIFGTIQAGLGAANLGTNIAGLVQRGTQFNRSADMQQQGIDLAQQKTAYDQSKDMLEMIVGGAQASSLIGGARMQMDRQAQTFDLSTTRGTQQQLKDISSEQQKINFDRILQGDEDALAAGLRDGSVTYAPGVQAQMTKDQAALTNLQSNPAIQEDHRRAGMDALSARIASSRFMVQKNTMRPMTDEESAQSSFQYVGDPETGKRRLVQRDRSDGVWREATSEAEKHQRAMELETHKADLVAKGGRKSGSTPIYDADGNVDPNSVDADYMSGLVTDLHKERIELFKAVSAHNALYQDNPKMQEALPDLKKPISSEEIQARLNMALSAPRAAAARINMPQAMQQQGPAMFGQVAVAPQGVPQQPNPGLPNDIVNRAAVGNTLPADGLGGTQGIPGVMPEELPAPQPQQPTQSTRGSTMAKQGSPGVVTKLNAPAQNIPASTPKAAKATQSYIQEAEAVPVPAGMKKSVIKLSGTNVAAKLGLDEVVVYSDSSGEYPVLTNKTLFDRYNREAPAGSRFIGPDSQWYRTSKPASK